MSVISTAGEHKSKAIVDLRNCIENLEIFLNPETCGNEDYSEEYIMIVENGLHDIRKLRRKLLGD